MEVFLGVHASEGIGIGTAFVIPEPVVRAIPQHRINYDQMQKGWKRFEQAIQTVTIELSEILDSLSKTDEKDSVQREIFETYILMLGDPVFNQEVKDFYENEELIALTRELTETLRRNKTIDWQKRNTARARMRMMIKRLLKKYKYPPEGMEDALETVMTQCELWTDNNDMRSEATIFGKTAVNEAAQLKDDPVKEPAKEPTKDSVKKPEKKTAKEPAKPKTPTFTYEPYKPAQQKVAESVVPYEHKHPGAK